MRGVGVPPWRDWMEEPKRKPVITLPTRLGDLVIRQATTGLWARDEMTLNIADTHGPRLIDLQLVNGAWLVVGVWDEVREQRLPLDLTDAQREAVEALAGILTRAEALRSERRRFVHAARMDLWLVGAGRA